MGTVDVFVEVEVFLHELLLVNYSFRFYFLHPSHNGFLRNTWTKRLLMIATLVMFVSATASWIEVTADVLLYLPHRIHPETKRPSSLIREHNGLVTAKDVSVRIVYILSDAMVVQRAWVLWPQNKKVKILLCGCILVTIGTRPKFLSSSRSVVDA